MTTDKPESAFEAWWRSRGGSFAFMGHGPRYIAEDVWNAALAEAAAVCDRIAANCAMFEPKDWTGGRTAAECRDAIKRLEER